MTTYSAPIDRFNEAVEKSDGCWMWRGFITTKGYGNFSVDGVKTYVHRWS